MFGRNLRSGNSGRRQKKDAPEIWSLTMRERQDKRRRKGRKGMTGPLFFPLLLAEVQSWIPARRFFFKTRIFPHFNDLLEWRTHLGVCTFCLGDLLKLSENLKELFLSLKCNLWLYIHRFGSGVSGFCPHAKIFFFPYLPWLASITKVKRRNILSCAC